MRTDAVPNGAEPVPGNGFFVSLFDFWHSKKLRALLCVLRRLQSTSGRRIHIIARQLLGAAIIALSLVPILGGATSWATTAGIDGIAIAPDGGGYYLVRYDGAVFLFGDAQNHGDL
jgi:hypothetical protein